MGEMNQGWNLTESEWDRVVQTSARGVDVLDNGAFVRSAVVNGEEAEIQFYASPINKPPAWHYPFMDSFPEGVNASERSLLGADGRSARRDSVPGSDNRVAYVGRAYHHAPTGFVEFEVEIPAAAQALLADYAGGAGDYDDVTIEQAIEAAMRGTPADLEWLKATFERLLRFVRHDQAGER